jgi:hypothetical protein
MRRVPGAFKPKVQSKISEFYSEEELAASLALSIHTLRAWRRRGIGPPHVKIASGHSRCFYRRASVERWLRASERTNGRNRQAKHAR